MNSYLSRDEKTSLVRLEVLAISQEAVLEIYQNTKSTDGEFLKCLRTSQTWLKKAIAKRKSFLSEDAKLDFIRQAARLKIIFVPSDEPNEVEDVENLPVEEATVDEEVTIAANLEPAKEEAPEITEQGVPATVPVEIYLASGVQLALEVPQHMAEQLLKGMKGLPKHNRPVCACHVGEELIAVDTQEVAVFRARGIGKCELERSNNPMGNQNALPSRNAPTGNKNAVQRSIETAAFKIECKCGADYFCQLSSNSPKARCRDCGAPVYTDWEIKDVFPGTGEEATLMTNRYFVEQKGTGKEPEWKKKEISGPTLGQYREPCKIFE